MIIFYSFKWIHNIFSTLFYFSYFLRFFNPLSFCVCLLFSSFLIISLFPFSYKLFPLSFPSRPSFPPFFPLPPFLPFPPSLTVLADLTATDHFLFFVLRFEHLEKNCFCCLFFVPLFIEHPNLSLILAPSLPEIHNFLNSGFCTLIFNTFSFCSCSHTGKSEQHFGQNLSSLL